MSTGSHHLTGKLSPRSMLQGRYLIVGLVGQGGMGAVYEAVDTSSHPKRRVAIKELSQSNLNTPAEVEKAKNRFRAEANMLCSLNHPNLPHVYDSFEEGHRLYLVMDFIAGQTLLQMLQAVYGRPLPVDQVLNYACQLCDVLSYLHRQFPPIIFRDLKPSNVMVTADGHVYLIDFGIARFFKPGEMHDTEAFGSLAYASPQQLDGAQTSVASDLYSLGATLHHCLTGKMPAYAQNGNRYPSARSINALVPLGLDRLIASLVEVKEGKRPKSADAVLHTLQKLKPQVGTLTQGHAQRDTSSYLWDTVNGSGEYKRLILSGADSGAKPGDVTFPLNKPLLPAKSLADRMIAVEDIFKRLGAMITGQPFTGVSSWSSRVLTPKFVVVLILRLALLLAFTVFGVQVFGSYTIVAFGLAVLLLVITASASISARVRDPVARSLLFCTAIAMFVACIALQATADVQPILHTVTLGQLLSILLVTTAAISLLRTTNRLAWADHITMVLVTAICALLQFTLFYQELHHLPGLSSDIIATSSSVRDILTSALAFIAFLFLCRVASSFAGFDRFMVVLVAIVYALLQFAFGFDELQHLWLFAHIPASTDTLLYAGYVYVILLGIPPISTLVALFIGRRYPLAQRIAIFTLAIACALLQSALDRNIELLLPTAQLIQPLTIRVVDLLTSTQIFMYSGLSVASLLLVVRLGRPLPWLERPTLFLLAGICALLQSAFWTDKIFQLQFPSGTIGSTTLNQVSVIAFNQLLATILLLLAVVGISIAVVSALVRVARYNASINHRATTLENRFNWVSGLAKLVDRLIIFGITLISTLLVTFFGDQSQLLAQPIPLQSQEIPLTVSQVTLAILALLTIVSLFRLGGRFNRWDCITLLLAIIADTSLAYGNANVQKIAPPLLSTLQQFTGTFLSGNGPQLLLFIGLLAVAAISLLWLRRTPPRLDAVLIFVLFVFFAGALLCIFLHYVWPVLLLAALLLLIHGIFVAIQMERVR